jgi:glycosyltransferase involved in cell wall biosynthesis
VNRAELRARLGVERFALLTLARLVPVKGLPEAVRALAHRGDLEWLIAGEGPERAALEALARTSSLRVRVLGHVAGADKSALLHAADAFVLPSRVLPSGRSEGAPTALLEAMAAGLPVIASAVGGVGELVRDGETGWSFEPHEPAALEAAVERVLRAPEDARRVAAGARAFAERQCWSTLAPAIEAALRLEPAARTPPAPAHELRCDEAGQQPAVGTSTTP